MADVKDNFYVLELLGKNKELISTPKTELQKLKKQYRINLLNDITLVDMAYFYAIQGQKQKSSKCIDIALSLNPKNIFSIKSIVKFFLLNRDVDKALWLLHRDEDISHNPQLMSSEISICELYGEKSKMLRKANSITKTGR